MNDCELRRQSHAATRCDLIWLYPPNCLVRDGPWASPVCGCKAVADRLSQSLDPVSRAAEIIPRHLSATEASRVIDDRSVRTSVTKLQQGLWQ
jgi:hypothetical protein